MKGSIAQHEFIRRGHEVDRNRIGSNVRMKLNQMAWSDIVENISWNIKVVIDKEIQAEVERL